MLAASTIVVVFLATFLACAMAVVIAWMIVQRREPVVADPAAAWDDSPLLKNDALSTVAVLSSVLAQFDFVRTVNARIAEAGMSWSVGRLGAMMLLIGTVVLAAAVNLDWLPVWAGLTASVWAGLAPYLYVLRRRTSRLAKLEEQLPDAMDYLARALRAGHPLGVSLEMLAGECSPPLAAEIRKTSDERQLGMDWSSALGNLSVRAPLLDVSFFAAAVQLQSRTGGKLGDVLGRLAETVRERMALRGEVRSIAAHGRLTGLVLTLIPVIVLVLMAAVNPTYVQILVSHPRGKDLLLAAAVCLVLAHLVIRRMVNVKL